ncbi:MAG: hypothetical protein GTO63_03830, partial [Anaerolineae bacterium]|nr:hypothetical protein [Anaerolineae bacterium]NIN94142.1 hypothetical protein [Anaerolineae bacterium]
QVRTLPDILRNEGSEAFMAEYQERSVELEDVDCWFPYLQFDLARLGFEMLQSERLDEAVAAFQLNTIRYPESWRTWDDLGDGYR